MADFFSCLFKPCFGGAAGRPGSYLAVPTTSDGDRGYPSASERVRKTVAGVIESKLNSRLREISIEIHDNPELAFEERRASALLIEFLESHGFTVERGVFGMETAFIAHFKHRLEGKEHVRIGFCSEYDALPGLGHACGHNLIAITGIASAVGTSAAPNKGFDSTQLISYVMIAVKETIVEHNLSATVTLYGTPAEENGGGKVRMVKAGAFRNLDICLMVHPMGEDDADPHTLASQTIVVDYVGRAAHAAARPWDGINALDGVCQAFTNISQMRQQMKPTDRVHGIITKGGEKPNIIPEHTQAKIIVRSQTSAEMEQLVRRTTHCLTAAAWATGTMVDVSFPVAYKELRNNTVLSALYRGEMERRGVQFPPEGGGGAYPATKVLPTGSTDFGDVSHAVPGLHAVFSIGVPPDAGMHTKPFRDAARSAKAHNAALGAAQGIALAALAVAEHPSLLKAVRQAFRSLEMGPISDKKPADPNGKIV